MAITVSLTTSAVTLSTTNGISTFTLTDNSVYTSPSRGSVAVYVTIFKVAYNGNRSSITTTSNNNNPATDSIWTGIFTTDGWNQALYAAIPNYSAGTFNQYDAVYIASNKTVWRSSIAANSNALTGSGGTGWDIITDPTSLVLNTGLSNQSNNITASIPNFVLYPLIKQQFGLQTGIAFLEQSTDSKRTKDVLKYHLYALAVDSINQADIASDYALAEIIARRASAIT